jgi:8-oxo-dGTP diphosphatase
VGQKGCGILFFDKEGRRVLVFQRDSKPGIPFPNQLDILGGHVEEGETPLQAVIRETAEELGDKRTRSPYKLVNPQLFLRYTDDRGVEQSIFCAPANFDITALLLNEGQQLIWLEERELAFVKLAFNFDRVLAEFFASSYMK